MSGAFGATAAGIATQIWGNAFISGAESFINQGIENGFGNINYFDVLFDGIIGGYFGRNNGISRGTFNSLTTQKNKAVKRITKALLKYGRDGAIREAKLAERYYLSQTMGLYYRNLLLPKNIIVKEILKPSLKSICYYYGKQFAYNYWS